MNNIQSVVFLLQLCLTLKCSVLCLETASPEKYLLPRNFNPHPYQKSSEDSEDDEATSRYIQKITRKHNQVFGRKGPVIFPNNDSSPPPRNPLIVTSRPLLEDIARSDQSGSILTPKPPTAIESIQRIAGEDYTNSLLSSGSVNDRNYYQNTNTNNRYPYQNNVAQQTYNGYLKQLFGTRPNPELYKLQNVNTITNTNSNNVLDYQDVLYNGLVIPAGNGQTNTGNVIYPALRNRTTLLDRHPYADLTRKSQLLGNEGRPGYDIAEELTVVPPIYQALGRYANNKVLKNVRKAKVNPSWREQETNTVENTPDHDEDNGDYYNDNPDNEEKQYAFSYSVKDHETGDDFSHSQRHVGSATKGEYRVKLPDGRMQIVSYTADNGGYKADVRYEEDSEATSQKNDGRADVNYQQHVHQNIRNDNSRKYLPHKAVTLGRIIVPSQDDADYQDEDYNNNYNDISSTTAPFDYRNYVTNSLKEVLITSKPGYLYTPAPTQNNLIYNQYLHRNRYIPRATPSPKTYLFGTSSTYSPLAEGSDQHNVYSTTTNDPQEASKTYSHFYNAESVKFVSTTPKYHNFNKQLTRFKSTTRIPQKTKNDENNNALSTAEPESMKYDQLDSPDVVKIEAKPKLTVSYTTLAPLLFNSIVANSASSTSPKPEVTSIVSSSTQSLINPKESGKGARNFGGLDIRKYFTFTKR